MDSDRAERPKSNNQEANGQAGRAEPGSRDSRARHETNPDRRVQPVQNPPPQADRDETLRALHAWNLPPDGFVAELRIPTGRKGATISGYFDHAHRQDLATAAAKYSGRYTGIYVMLNPGQSFLLARAANRVNERAEHTTSDMDVAEIRYFPIDLDGVPTAGISSTDQEHRTAIGRGAEIMNDLQPYGFPKGGWDLIDSGNGAWLTGHLEPLPNSDETRALIDDAMVAVETWHGGRGIKIDKTSTNPSRIVALPGTWKKKGDSTPERPHRMTQILRPNEGALIPRAALEALAATVPKPVVGLRPPAHPAGRFDVKEFLVSKGFSIEHEDRHPLHGRPATRLVLDRCPFNPAHNEPRVAAVLICDDGPIVLRCKHNSCFGKDWKDARLILDPDYASRKAAGQAAEERTRGLRRRVINGGSS